MLRRLDVRKLTAFRVADFRFCNGVNVVIGENGSGKSHLLRMAYAVIAAGADRNGPSASASPVKSTLQRTIATKLINVMRPESLGRLVRRRTGRQRCRLALEFENSAFDCVISLAAASRSEVSIDGCPTAWQDKAPVFLPPHELLTLYPGFVAVYDGHYLQFDEIHRDTCVLLGQPPPRDSRKALASASMEPIEREIGGTVELDVNGRFYLKVPGKSRIEMPLVAEGHRKLAMLARLIATGSLIESGYHFWDEPEANLNPSLIRSVALAILGLARDGIQVFVATHSLFLLRELVILSKTDEFGSVAQRYFALAISEDGVQVEQGDTADELQTLMLLDENLQQSDRYLALQD
ncbi:MAG: AAA family ATPase [Acidobacteria bacterium]|nr:AAA family ATPase [Acidobacteriota bacterium]